MTEKSIINELDTIFIEFKGKTEDNLTGTYFGKWKVLGYKGNYRWMCECQCNKHTKRIISRHDLISGHTKSCGCYRKEINAKNDLIGNTFDDITVIDSLGRGRYKCKCKCGADKEMTGNDIRRGHGTHCNHLEEQYLDSLVGTMFGELEVIGHKGKKMICKCSCGNIKEYYLSALKQGNIVACGHKLNQYEDLTGQTFGYLDIIKRLDGNRYICKCRCGNPELIIKTASNIKAAGENNSCGCMTRYIQCIKKDSTYSKDRTTEQINATSNRDKLIGFIIQNFNYKPTRLELAERLGINASGTSRYIAMYSIEDYIEDGNLVSKPEKEITEYIEDLCNNKYKIIKHDRTLISPQEIDIYIPEKKLAIEFNGTYWHSIEAGSKDKEYHQRKTIECAKQNVHLIHIFEYEWNDDSTQTKIKTLLREMIESDDKIVYGRETEIRLVSKVDADEFINKYHLQNSTQASIRIGCYYRNELLSIITFGKPRFNNEYEYEIIRLCYKPGFRIVGGLEKMFKYFLKEYNPSSIITYADITKFTGNSYSKIGFKPVAKPITVPNYVWCNLKTNDVMSRYQAQKHKLVESGLGTPEQTEDEIMHSLKYYKVYNSGNIILEWRNK